MNFEREKKLEEGKGGAASLRVIADHARATTFLISDGVVPSNEGRGYVLRKIVRRAIRHGYLLGMQRPFMHDMVYAVRDVMRVAYPELSESTPRVAEIVLSEEKRFTRALAVGLKELGRLEDEYRQSELIAKDPNPLENWGATAEEAREHKYSGLGRAYFSWTIGISPLRYLWAA